MAGPWERYQQQPSAPAPWERYQQQAVPQADPQAAPRAQNPDEWADLPIPGTFTPQEPEPEPSLIDQIMGGLGYAANTAGIAAYDALGGAANIAGLPVDAVNASPMLLNMIPGVDDVGPMSQYPFGGSAMLNDLVTLGGNVQRPEPEDAFQRTVGRTAEEIGAAAIPGMGIIGKARSMGLPAIRELSRFALTNPSTWGQGLGRMFLEPAAVSPRAFLGSELGIAAGAGLGASTANELTGNQDRENPWIDVGGALGGATLTGVGTATGKALSDLFRAATNNPQFADDVVREAVMREIGAHSGITAAPGEALDLTPIINQVERNAPISETIPGFTESLADRTGNPGLAALEYARQSGPNAGTYAQQRAGNTAAIDNVVSQVEPQGTPGQLSSALEAERTAQLSGAATATAQAQSAFEQATSGLLPALTAEARGANIRNSLEDASEAAKQVLAQAWEPMNASRQTVDIDPLRAQFNQITSELSEAERMRFSPQEAGIPERLVTPGQPDQPTGLLDASGNPIMRPGEGPTVMQPLNEITGIRSALTDAQREAASAGRTNEARVIGEYIDNLDRYMESSLPEQLQQQYAAAREATFDFNERFTRPQSGIAQTLATREGLPRSPDSAVPGRFVQSDQGRISDFEALMREAGSDDRVRLSVRDQILQDVSDRGLLERPEQLQSYLDQYGTVFNKFPDLKDELGNAANLRQQLVQAQEAEQGLQRMLTTQNGSTVARYLTYGDENASAAMRGVLSSRDPANAIDELLTFVNDAPDAVEGARKVFWDIMQERSRSGGRTTMTLDGRQPWSPQALSSFLNDPRYSAVAERLWQSNPEHLEHIRSISEVLSGVDLRNSARAPNTSGTTQGMSQVLTPESIQSRLYAFGSGRISGTFLVTALASVVARRTMRRAQDQGFQRMLDDVLTNADTAALLMRQNNPADRQALSAKAKMWFGNEASSILNAMSEEPQSEDDPESVIIRRQAEEWGAN